MDSDRYGKDHAYGKVTFHLSTYQPNEEECQFLVLKILEQSVRDYMSLFGSNFSADQTSWLTAAGFIFDDDFILQWGDWEISSAELLECINIDISWVRQRVEAQFKKKFGEE